MNKTSEKFHRENEILINQLIERLSSIFESVSHEKAPVEADKEEAINLLNAYMDSLNSFMKQKSVAFKRLQEKTGIKFDEKESEIELIGYRDIIALLVKLCREKMIPADDLEVNNSSGEVFFEKGYCEKIRLIDQEKDYYILTEKSEKTLRNKALMMKLREEMASAIIPVSIVDDTSNWSDLYVQRMAIINDFFRQKKSGAEYVSFSLGETKDMVFACEISGNIESVYYFAGIFDENIGSNVQQLANIADSGLLDSLTVITTSESAEKELIERGLNPDKMTQVLFERIEG